MQMPFYNYLKALDLTCCYQEMWVRILSIIGGAKQQFYFGRIKFFVQFFVIGLSSI